MFLIVIVIVKLLILLRPWSDCSYYNKFGRVGQGEINIVLISYLLIIQRNIIKQKTAL